MTTFDATRALELADRLFTQCPNTTHRDVSDMLRAAVVENEKLRAALNESQEAFAMMDALALRTHADLRLARAVVDAAKDYTDPSEPMISFDKYGRLRDALADFDAHTQGSADDPEHWEQSVHEKSGKLLGTTPIRRTP